MSSSSAGNAKPTSAPVKWTLVEAVADTPQRKGKKGASGDRTRLGGRGPSSSADNWRQPRGGGGGAGGGGGGGSSRNNNQRSGQGRGRGYGRGYGQGRGRGYGAYVGGATYYPQTFGAVEMPSVEEQKAYMTSMAVKQIEFYFTVENLCKDIFIRSYMDEEGYIPIAFVANFPGVARFGVELEDITAGILASDALQVDTENETMRMREGWKVWLLPNQATGKQGVPRYIKVDPATDSATDPGEAAAASVVDATEPEVAAGEPLQSSQPSEGEVSDLDKTKVDDADNADGASKKEGDKVTERVTKEEQQGISANAPAWTPGGVATDVAEENSSPTPVPSDDKVEPTNANTAS